MYDIGLGRARVARRSTVKISAAISTTISFLHFTGGVIMLFSYKGSSQHWFYFSWFSGWTRKHKDYFILSKMKYLFHSLGFFIIIIFIFFSKEKKVVFPSKILLWDVKFWFCKQQGAKTAIFSKIFLFHSLVVKKLENVAWFCQVSG